MATVLLCRSITTYFTSYYTSLIKFGNFKALLCRKEIIFSFFRIYVINISVLHNVRKFIHLFLRYDIYLNFYVYCIDIYLLKNEVLFYSFIDLRKNYFFSVCLLIYSICLSSSTSKYYFQTYL
jgi:hypothetical protein